MATDISGKTLTEDVICDYRVSAKKGRESFFRDQVDSGPSGSFKRRELSRAKALEIPLSGPSCRLAN